jgi:N-acetylmuramoyl-L-alanine amidase
MATIVIDPGHYQGYNPGVCPGYYEGTRMLKLAQYLGDALIRKGATVKYTRTSGDQNPTLAERGAMGAGADLFISLHSDASDDPSVRGVTSYYSIKRPNSKPFAEEIGKAAAEAMGNQFRGAYTRAYPNRPDLDYYGVIRAAAQAGAKNVFLIEHGFHTNMMDCEILNSDEGLRRIAEAEANVIARYFNLGCNDMGNCHSFQYTVKPGEYLYIIAERFGVTWQCIAQYNGIVYPYIIYPGQVITIPLCS